MKKFMLVLLLVLILTLNVFGEAKQYNPDNLPRISIEAVHNDAVILDSTDEYVIIEQDDEIFLVVK